MKKLVVTPLSNTIWYATVNKDCSKITGNREDVTSDAIRAVFEWFMGNMNEDVEEYKVKFPTSKYAEYELVMRRRDVK